MSWSLTASGHAASPEQEEALAGDLVHLFRKHAEAGVYAFNFSSEAITFDATALTPPDKDDATTVAEFEEAVNTNGPVYAKEVLDDPSVPAGEHVASTGELTG